ALVFFNYAVVVRTVGGLWERLDPRTAQAARALGASRARAFWSVTLPAQAPAIASAASVVFLFCATAFGIMLVLGGIQFGTVETEIWLQTTQMLNLRAASVLSIVQLIVVVGALAVISRTRARRGRALTLHGRPASVPRLVLVRRGRPGVDALPTLVTVLLAWTLLLTPMAALVAGSLRTPKGWGLGHYVALGST